MINPLISIIVPIYNVEAYIARCMNSIKDQTYENIEILAINDGSTDKSLSILEDIGKVDNRIQIINKENGGQASARNLGISIAKGEYFMFVDSDDFIDKNAVQECVAVLNNKICDLIIFDYFKLKNDQKEYVQAGKYLHNSKSAPWNKLYSRELWQNFRFPEGYWYEDLGIVPAVVANADRIEKLDKALYYYETSRDTSQTNIINPLKLNDKIHMVKNIYKELEKQGKLNENINEVEYLFIDHLLNGLLFKITNVEDKNVRITIANSIKETMERYFPDWDSNKYHKKSFKKIVKRIVINKYLQGEFLLGDVLLKYPQRLKAKIR